MNTTEITTQPKEGKFKTSLKITRAAWRVIKLDKEILGISALAVLASISLLVPYLAILFIFHEVFFLINDEEFVTTPWFYVMSALMMLIGYIISNYFAGAISHAAFRRFDGHDPTFSESLGAASKKLPALINFSGLQATVGLILNILEERLPIAGRVAVWLTGAAWGIATMFAIPLIMDKGERNPLKVVKTSAQTFVSIWKESVFVGVSLGVIGVVSTVAIVFFALGFAGFAIALSSISLGIVAAIVLVSGIIGITIVTQALQSVVMTAAYYYASRQKLPAGFDEELIRSMFRPKKKWLK